MSNRTKPKVERTPSGLWSWFCRCGMSGLLGLEAQQGTYLKALNHARRFHGHSTYEDCGGGWWRYTCKICKKSNFHYSLERVLDKSDEHYWWFHEEVAQ